VRRETAGAGERWYSCETHYGWGEVWHDLSPIEKQPEEGLREKLQRKAKERGSCHHDRQDAPLAASNDRDLRKKRLKKKKEEPKRKKKKLKGRRPMTSACQDHQPGIPMPELPSQRKRMESGAKWMPNAVNTEAHTNEKRKVSAKTLPTSDPVRPEAAKPAPETLKVPVREDSIEQARGKNHSTGAGGRRIGQGSPPVSKRPTRAKSKKPAALPINTKVYSHKDEEESLKSLRGKTKILKNNGKRRKKRRASAGSKDL